MNMIKKILCILTMIATTSCASLGKPRAEYIDAAYATMGKHISSQKRYGLVPMGTGGCMTRDVEELDIHYVTQQTLDIAEVRKIFVNSVESLIDLANNDARLQPFMHCYPFTNLNASVAISFEDINNRRVKKPAIALVFNCRSKIYYEIIDDATGALETVYKEDYEEAKRIVLGDSAVY